MKENVKWLDHLRQTVLFTESIYHILTLLRLSGIINKLATYMWA